MNNEYKAGYRALRSLLYIPGGNPGMIQNCAIYGADGVLLDLEDAIAFDEKDAARKLVKYALRTLDFGDVTKVVRINGRDTEFFERDISEIVMGRPDSLRIPKIDCADDILLADKLISEAEEKSGIPVGTVKIQAMLETARAIMNCDSIAAASGRISALTLGGQDLAADLGIQATPEGTELLYAKSRVIIAAKAFGLEAYDTVYTNVNDLDGLLIQTKKAAALGFNGKAAIHPSQVPVINAAYTPDKKEIEKARRVVEAAEEAARKGIGVISVDGRMVDKPVVAQAERTLALGRKK